MFVITVKKENTAIFCIIIIIQKMLQLPNVLITPHNAYNTKEATNRIIKITKENICSTFDLKYGAKNIVLI